MVTHSNRIVECGDELSSFLGGSLEEYKYKYKKG
jgi:hypothetical protein